MYKIAKDVILMFAKSMRHGLMPNLLDCARNSRFNCRDATWWFVKSIGDYINFTKDTDILKEKVKMSFLSYNQKEHEEKCARGEQKVMTLEEIIFEIFQCHASGIHFREWNAGDQIDWNMRYEGYDISLELDEQTGFVVGGNPYKLFNMDGQNGSSDKASNRGIPATPRFENRGICLKLIYFDRDGAPVDMTALLKHCLTLVSKLNSEGKFSYDHVKTISGANSPLKNG